MEGHLLPSSTLRIDGVPPIFPSTCQQLIVVLAYKPGMRVSCLLFNQARVLNRAVKSVKSSAEFPCIHDFEAVAAKLKIKNVTKQCHQGLNYQAPSGFMNITSLNEPVYEKVKKYQLFRSPAPLLLDYGGMLPQFDIAFETWGRMNKDKSNVILIHPGLSASFHAHSSEANPSPGWWESFIGPGSNILDTEKYFLICTNMLGSCYGSTGPQSPHPSDNRPYATRFPMLSIHDIVRAQHKLIKEHFKIDKLYAVVGSSMGGMQSLAYGQLFPNEVEKIVSVSACARSHPSSIAQRHTQRQALMSDPNWNNGYYYPTPEDPDRSPPHVGMRLARQIATISYRSGPEWELRFGTERVDDSRPPVLHTDFLVERYLDYQGSKFATEFDANSMLYLSKAMDLFDMSLSNLIKCESRRRATAAELTSGIVNYKGPCQEHIFSSKKSRTSSLAEAKKDLQAGVQALRDKEVLIVGVKSDVLFPYRQQREIVELLGNGPTITHVELTEEQSLFGHDTFLLDTTYLGPSIGGFLST